jgi:hypothetical protein
MQFLIIATFFMMIGLVGGNWFPLTENTDVVPFTAVGEVSDNFYHPNVPYGIGQAKGSVAMAQYNEDITVACLDYATEHPGFTGNLSAGSVGLPAGLNDVLSSPNSQNVYCSIQGAWIPNQTNPGRKIIIGMLVYPGSYSKIQADTSSSQLWPVPNPNNQYLYGAAFITNEVFITN